MHVEYKSSINNAMTAVHKSLTYSSTHWNASAGVVDLNVIMRIVMPVDDQALQSGVKLGPLQCSEESRSRNLLKCPVQIKKGHYAASTVKSRL